MIKQCPYCGVEFETVKKHPYQKYCSERCKKRGYYAAHREERKAYHRAYYAANREAINAWKRKCRRIGRSNHD